MSKPRPVKKISIPSSLSILGQEFRVEYAHLDDGDYGETTGYEQVIKISDRHPQSKQMLNRTLFHEAIHAVLHVTGHTEMLSENQEEALIMALESAFADRVNMLADKDLT